MKNALLIGLMTVCLCGCVNSESQRDRMVLGAGLGAATGLTVGAAAGSTVGSSIAGAFIGAVGGGIIGAVTTPTNCIAYDENRQPIKVRCP